MHIVVYDKIVRIGGVYTFDLNFVRQFGKDHQISYVYEAGDLPQINEIGQYCNLIKNTGQIIECDLCLFSSLYQGGHRIKARKYAQMLHADLTAWKVVYKPVNIDFHIAVGKGVADSFKASHGIDATIIPNMLQEPKLDKVLRLVTASRVDNGKGFDRLVKIAKALKAANKKFVWEVYGNGSRNFMNDLEYELTYVPDVVMMGSRNEVQSYMQVADYVVQLSDNEGFCYSIYEALQIGKPVIVTRWPGVEDVVKDGENGYILEMDLSNLDVGKLYNSIPRGGKLKVRNSVQLWNNLFQVI